MTFDEQALISSKSKLRVSLLTLHLCNGSITRTNLILRKRKAPYVGHLTPDNLILMLLRDKQFDVWTVNKTFEGQCLVGGEPADIHKN